MRRFFEVGDWAKRGTVKRESWYKPYLPARATAHSAGYDFFCPEDITIEPHELITVWTNVKAYMETDDVLQIYIRSSLGKKGLMLANSCGIVDCDYAGNPDNDGNIGIMLKNLSDKPMSFKRGDKIAQGIFSRYLVTDDDDTIKERTGGFGSTGE